MPTYLCMHAERVCEVQYDLVGVSLCALTAVCWRDIMDCFRLLFSPPESFFHADPLWLWCDNLSVFSTPAFCMVKLHYQANSYHPSSPTGLPSGSPLFPPSLSLARTGTPVLGAAVLDVLLHPSASLFQQLKSFVPAEENGSIHPETSHQHPRLLGHPIKLCMGGLYLFPLAFSLTCPFLLPRHLLSHNPFSWYHDHGSFWHALFRPPHSLWSIPFFCLFTWLAQLPLMFLSFISSRDICVFGLSCISQGRRAN